MSVLEIFRSFLLVWWLIFEMVVVGVVLELVVVGWF